MREVM